MLEVKNLKKTFIIKKSSLSREEVVTAVNDVSFKLEKGDSYGIIGESGSGKSTIGNLIARLSIPTEGEIYYSGNNIVKYKGKQLRELRREIQVIFQSGKETLDPKMTIYDLLLTPFRLYDICPNDKIDIVIEKLLSDVGLSNEVLMKFPHQLSGGMLQRVSIARVLAVKPKLIICDEPISALDVSVQGLIINLLVELKEKYGFTYIFITHNLKVIKHICNRIAVLKNGKIVEEDITNKILEFPTDEYTIKLIKSML